MAEKDPSRTEPATQKRITDARKKGSVAKSAELPKLAVLLMGALAVRMTIGTYESELTAIFRWFLSEGMRTEITMGSVNAMLVDVCMRLAKMLLPLLLIIAATAYTVMRVQVGSLWINHLANFDWGKLFNPMNGLKALFADPKALVRLARQVAQAAAIAIAPYIVLKKEFASFIPLFYNNAHGLAVYILQSSMTMLWYTLVPMALIAAFDVWYTRWDYAESMKMTKSEVKDEHRNVEGDPQVKSKQRQKMFEVMGKRMLKNVPKADVVITNPTHIAVALQYNPLIAPAPIVVAKGADHLAKKIKDIAYDNGVPVRENKPLARALYKDSDVGEVIPEELFQAVAAVLATLDKFRNRIPR
ncbi:flagellar type III secretion system protein FlhB [Fundidesulfovibrio agrisoli]|uniref:flagellar type III secretion system protein FlhB n=1 Tax=Fundidesulfovibrio agrisoli TaxID=2922717 RepID=UPI001FAE43AC|nr:flagellar type III secretion system protein FlhB [Fundidesulfovibrio agrisoli]